MILTTIIIVVRLHRLAYMQMWPVAMLLQMCVVTGLSVSDSLFLTTMSPAKMAEPVEVLFKM